jgi:hypothetical protein
VGALRRTFDIVFPLLIAAALVLVAFPDYMYEEESRLLEVRQKVAKGLFKPMSMSQHWGMYAPDPARAMTYMHLIAESKGSYTFPRGKQDPVVEPGEAPPGTWRLEEADLADAGWGTIWGWQKTREDIWRYRLSMKKPKSPNRNRTWYMRGVCVREARAGRYPAYIQMQQLKRHFTKPSRVSEGKPEFGPRKFTRSDRTWCRSSVAAEMIEKDRERNPEAYAK